MESELVLPTHLNFKKLQMYEKYPKGQPRSRHWKHLKQILQADNFQNYPPDEPNCEFISHSQFIFCFSLVIVSLGFVISLELHMVVFIILMGLGIGSFCLKILISRP